MHCIATSMCFWIYTIVQETIDYIVKKYITEPVNCDDYDDAGFGDDTNKNQSLLTPRAGDERCKYLYNFKGVVENGIFRLIKIVYILPQPTYS
jgi:hypothetical protein